VIVFEKVRRGCILLKTKEIFSLYDNIYYFPAHGTLFACYQGVHRIAKLIEVVFVDLKGLVVRPELQPLQGALPIPII
jgi:hypothetical protein